MAERNPYLDMVEASAMAQNPYMQMAAQSRFEGGENPWKIDFTRPAEEVRKDVDKLQGQDRKDALDVWAKSYVAKERAEGGVGLALGNIGRAIARGTPIGSWLDELTAATSSLPYDETVAYQRARDRALDEAHPVASTAGQIAGGVASVPAIFGTAALTGGSIASRAASGLLPGATWGAIYGAGEGEGNPLEGEGNRLTTGVFGAGIGAAGGALAPVVGAGIGNAAGYLASRFGALPRELRQFSRGAVDRVARALREDEVTGQSLAQTGRELGPEGMLLDLGPNVLGHAETLAQRPGRGATTLLKAVTERGKGAEGRIRADTDIALGPEQNTPALLRRLTKERSTEATGLYGALRGAATAPIWSPVLQELTSRPSVQRAIRNAVSTASERGVKVANPFIRKGGQLTLKKGASPTFTFWDHIKRGLDQEIARDPTNRDLVATSRALRDELDELVPGYAEARKKFAERSAVIGAVEEGKTAFKKGLDPEELRFDMAERSIPEAAGFRVGARQQIKDIMGEAVDPESTARRTFKSPYARERLGVVLGDDGAERLIRRLNAEEKFQGAENTLRGNSATARRQAFQQLYPRAGVSPFEGLQNSSIGGMVMRGGMEALNAMFRGAMGENIRLIAEDAARLLASSGDARDRLAAALLRRASRLENVQASSDLIERIAQAFTQAQRAPVASGILGSPEETPVPALFR